MTSISKIAVIGAGTMGNGIAQVCATHGFQVRLCDLKQESLDRAVKNITKSLSKFVEKEKLTQQEMDDSLGRLQTSTSIDDCQDAQLAIEAVTELFSVKEQIFQKLDSVCPPETLLASNTSSISITELASTTQRPDRVIGMHFMNPVPLMKLIEIIRGHQTSDETSASIRSLGESLGKTPIECHDYPGFVANRILLPMINEAVFALMEGVAEAEAIDGIMKLGMNHPMGPLTLADFIGLDVCLHILNVMHEGLGDPKYRPCPLLKKMVAAGKLGRKSGQGFYNYT